MMGSGERCLSKLSSMGRAFRYSSLRSSSTLKSGSHKLNIQLAIIFTPVNSIPKKEDILSNEKLCKIETSTIIKWVPTNASSQENRKCFDGNPKSPNKRKSPKNKSPLNFDLSSSKMSVPRLLPSTQDFCMSIEEKSDLNVATSKL
jgi:hypothetical protein